MSSSVFFESPSDSDGSDRAKKTTNLVVVYRNNTINVNKQDLQDLLLGKLNWVYLNTGQALKVLYICKSRLKLDGLNFKEFKIVLILHSQKVLKASDRHKNNSGI